MPIEKILRHVFRNDHFVGFEQVEVALSHLGSDLEANMQELAQTAVVGRGPAHMAQRGGVLLRGPTTHNAGRRELGRINVDDRRIGRAELFTVRVRFRINILRQRKAIAPKTPEPNDIEQPNSSLRGLVAGCPRPCPGGRPGPFTL